MTELKDQLSLLGRKTEYKQDYAIASTDQELKPTVFPASGWSWEKADKEVMEKTPKELLPEDKNARVSISY